jgi:transcription elongation factor SPT6
MIQGMSGFAGEEYLDVLSKRQIPLIYVHDDVARLYMNSARAIQENPGWPANSRYALGLARFTQDPLNEYCALGADLVAITYVPKLQALVSPA